MTDLIKNIQRIARTEELKELIENLITDEALDENARIDGTTYTAFETSNGGVGGGATAEDNGSLESENQDTDAANDENNTDGTPEEATGDEFADGEIGIGDQADFITGLEDCTTGEQLTVVTTDNYIPPNLGGLEGYTAQDWDDGNDPRNDSYDVGQYYSNAVGGGSTDSITGYGYATQTVANRDTLFPGDAPHSLDTFSYTSGSPSSITFTILKASGGVDTTVTLAAQNCPASGNPTLCSQVPESEDWPTDGIHQLKWDGGRFVTSAYEPLADQHGPWQNSPSKITACTPEGDQLTLQGSNNGNLLVTADTGDAAGNTYVINNEGTVTDILTGSIDQLLPK